MPPVDQQQTTGTTASPSLSSLSDSTLERLQRQVCGWRRSRAFFLHHFSLRSTGIAAQRIESWMGEVAPRPSTAAPPPPSPRTPLLLRESFMMNRKRHCSMPASRMGRRMGIGRLPWMLR
ncbi:hypothetical protein PAHAL_9G177000 [Panicum hallii]|uniref:Uncharacterized protein n=1 Tax=Panicum hallii TaxID=206008 RepID=A0A2T8I1J1_9POAL|nr:hypothetical protein PAHAL_9G177000 [Panicum hallii]